MLKITALATGLCALLASLANASMYPPDYVVSSQCTDSAHVRICAINRALGQGRAPRLQVSYSKDGPLFNSDNLMVSVQTSAGRSAVVGPLKKDYLGGSKFYPIGGLKDVQFCYHGEEGQAPDVAHPQYPRCPHPNKDYPPAAPGQGFVGWWADPVPEAEQGLFTQDQAVWEGEVTFVDAAGKKDGPYRYHF
ncbi:hypothetical protein HK102_002645 [Quaeritorhiza haematococci]|nr:hypothetical protein HK102_002645 [Quaeritorhiza haematococci]